MTETKLQRIVNPDTMLKPKHQKKYSAPHMHEVMKPMMTFESEDTRR